MSKQHYQASTYKAKESVGYLVKRAHSLMHDVMDPVLEAHGFSFIQYIMLAWLRDGVVINPKAFCALYRHDTGAFTRVVDQLVDRGFLERARRGGDRRKVELELTPAGRVAIEGIIPLVIEQLNIAFSDFSTAEFEDMQRLLIKLNTKLQSIIEPSAAAMEA